MTGSKTQQTTKHSILLACQPTTGGVARHVIDLSEGLAGREWDVTLACPSGGWLTKRIASPPVHLVDIPMAREIRPLPDLMAFWRLYRLCRRLRPDVLHAHSSKAGFLGRMAGAMARVPVVIYTPHCWSFQLATGRKRRMYARLERFASRFSTLTVTVSKREIDDAVALGVLDRSNARTVRNGVQAPADGSLPQDVSRMIEDNGSLVVAVGRPDEQKGHTYLLDAMRIVGESGQSAKLVVAGGGPLVEELQSSAKDMGLADSVLFTGEIEDVGPLLHRADLFVLSSLWGEGSPYTILEAMAAGLAVVTTDVGGCAELVENGVTGLVVPPKNADSLAQAIITLLKDPSRRKAMGVAGRDVALTGYTIDGLIDADEAFYLELLGDAGAAKQAQRNERRMNVTIPQSSSLTRQRARAAPETLRVVVIVLILAAMLVAVADEVIFAQKILPGVRVGPIDVGWMSRSSASRRLSHDLSQSRTLSIVWPGGSRKAPIDGRDFDIDTLAAADTAYEAGRVGDVAVRMDARLSGVTGGFEMQPDPHPVGSVEAALVAARSSLSRPARDAHFAMKGGDVVVVPSQTGAALDERGSAVELADAFLARARQAHLPTVLVKPKVTTRQASALKSQGERWSSGPAQVRLGARSVTLSPVQVLDATVVRGKSLTIDPVALRRELGAAASAVRRSATDARFVVSNNHVRIAGGQVGRTINMAATAERLTGALNSGSRSAVAAVSPVQPSVTRGDLAGYGISKLLSTYTTQFKLGQDGRDTNISLAAQAVRGKVLASGQTFSLNQTTGPRNRRTGYKESLIFQNGKVVPGIGGGVCQVSSTLYNAALLADMRIVKRYNHSMSVTYVPPGRDATTFYPGVDLQFQNDRPGPVLLWSQVKGNKLTMQVYGSGQKPRVTIKTAVRKMMSPKTQTVYDSKLRPGARVVESVGRPGYLVTSWRLVWKGKRVSQREFLATDKYAARAWLIRVGT